MSHTIMAIQRISRNISLTPELQRFVSALISSGRYQSASEVVRAGLRLLHRETGDIPHVDAQPGSVLLNGRLDNE